MGSSKTDSKVALIVACSSAIILEMACPCVVLHWGHCEWNLVDWGLPPWDRHCAVPWVILSPGDSTCQSAGNISDRGCDGSERRHWSTKEETAPFHLATITLKALLIIIFSAWYPGGQEEASWKSPSVAGNGMTALWRKCFCLEGSQILAFWVFASL